MLSFGTIAASGLLDFWTALLAVEGLAVLFEVAGLLRSIGAVRGRLPSGVLRSLGLGLDDAGGPITASCFSIVWRMNSGGRPVEAGGGRSAAGGVSFRIEFLLLPFQQSRTDPRAALGNRARVKRNLEGQRNTPLCPTLCS